MLTPEVPLHTDLGTEWDPNVYTARKLITSQDLE